MFFNKRYSCYFDWKNFLIILIISVIGLAFVFSSTYSEGIVFSLFFKKQCFGLIIGIFIYFLFSFIETNLLLKLGYIFYFFTIFLLVLILAKGSIGMGAKRWINLGLIKFQPSELSKLFFPIFLIYYFINSKYSEKLKSKIYICPVLTILISFLLILKQPDLGTGLILIFTGTLMLWLSSLKVKYFFTVGILIFLTLPISWKFLKSYQKKQLSVQSL